MVKQNKKKSAVNGTKRKGSVTLGQEELIKKDRETLDRMFARYIAWKFPLYEAGRNVVGFLKGMVSKDLTDSITDLLRGHSREMQCEIADSIRHLCPVAGNRPDGREACARRKRNSEKSRVAAGQRPGYIRQPAAQEAGQLDKRQVESLGGFGLS